MNLRISDDELLGNYYDKASPLDKGVNLSGLQEVADAQIASDLSLYDTPEKLKEKIANIISPACNSMACSAMNAGLDIVDAANYCGKVVEQISKTVSLHSLSLVAQAKKEERENIKSTICSEGHLIITKYGHGFFITDELWVELFHKGQALKQGE